MTDVVHLATLVSATTLCGLPIVPGMRPLLVGAPLVTRRPVCPDCHAARTDNRQ